MEETDLGTIKRRSVIGAVALTSRTFFLQIINFFSMFLLTIFLAPEIFGVFFVVSAVVNFLTYFSDIGLAAALIQKKDRLTKEDLKTTFTIQQTLVVFLVLISFLISDKIAFFYHLSPAALWLLRAMIISFFLSSLKTVPSILLERRLDFNRLVIPQIAEALVFNLVAVFLAWQGAGIISFTWAVLARGVIGLILIYILSPWKPGLALNRESARKLLSFGVPFQINSLLALIKDDFLTVFLGKILSFMEIGFIGWAQKWANFPLRFIMDSVIKVSFPAYSRLQGNLKALRSGIEKALFFVCGLTFPMLMGLVLLAAPLVEFLPRYLKWQPALLSLYLFSFQAMLACVSTTLTNTLNATGRIKTTLKLMILWTGLTWILTPILIFVWNFNGVALAALIVAATVILPIWLVRKIIDFSLKENIGKPLLATLIMGGGLWVLIPWLVKDLPSLFLIAFLGGIIYLLAIFILARNKLIEGKSLLLAILKR